MAPNPRLKAELRSWVKVKSDRDVFQGYVYNDIDHVKDGTFKTVIADNVEWNSDGLLIWEGNTIYWAWKVHAKEIPPEMPTGKATKEEFQTGLRKDLFDD